MSTDGASFTTDGKSYAPKSLYTTLNDGHVTIKVELPFLTKFKDSSLKLRVNGEEVKFDFGWD